MIGFTITIGIALVWLGYETNWMRVRLPCGGSHLIKFREAEAKPSSRQFKWQFQKYGEDALMLCQNCSLWKGGNCCLYHHFSKNKTCWFGWKISSRVIKLYDSTINFKEGCNRYRALIIRKIVRLQKSKALPTYHDKRSKSAVYFPQPPVQAIELFVDGKLVANVDGNYKRGDISNALKPYTTKVRIGRKTVSLPVGEADRVVTK